MSDVATGAGGAPAPGTDIVRGAGHAPGQSLGEAMPDIPKDVKAGRLSDFKREVTERARAKAEGRQPQQARNRVAEFSERLEARQQAPVQPNQPRPTADAPADRGMGDVNQLKEPANLARRPADEAAAEPTDPDSQQGEVVTDAGELEHAGKTLTDAELFARFQEWNSSDMFPEELEAKWLHELTGAGVTRYVDTKELKQGYIRGVDYRRFHQEAQAVHARAEQRDRSMQQHFEQIRDPGQMLEIYERNGYSETLLGVAHLIAQRERDDMDQIEAAGLALMKRKGITDWNHREVVDAMTRMKERIMRQRVTDIEARRVAFEREQLKQQQQQQASQAQTQEHYATYENQLNQLRPLVFRAYSIPDNKANRGALLKHLGAVIASQGMPATGLTRDMLMTAGRDLAEERESERTAGQVPVGLSPEQWQRVQAQKQSRALPPTRTSVGGGQPRGPAGTGQERGRLSDLTAMVRKSRMGQ